MTRKKKKMFADLKRHMCKNAIDKMLKASVKVLITNKDYSHRTATNRTFSFFDELIEGLCESNCKDAHLWRQAANMYKKELEILNGKIKISTSL